MVLTIGVRMLLASNGQRPRMGLNTLPVAGQPPTQRTLHSKGRKSCLGSGGAGRGGGRSLLHTTARITPSRLPKTLIARKLDLGNKLEKNGSNFKSTTNIEKVSFFIAMEGC